MTISLDTIFIKALKVPMSIGCLPWEKETLQTIQVDMSLTFPCQQAGDSDNLEHALDYSTLVQLLNEVAQAKHYNLVEHLAQTFCQQVLTAFPAQSVTVTVSKPDVISHVAAAGVTMTRSR